MKIRTIFFITSLLMLFSFHGFGQSTEVDLSIRVPFVTNNDIEDHSYRIHGICTSQDIGGVEVSFRGNGFWNVLVFENFNNFAVTVIFEIKRPNDSQTGTIVLRPNERRQTQNEFNFNPANTSFVLIVRRLSS